MTASQLYTLIHATLSVVTFISGLLVVKGLIFSHGRQLWTLLFLVTATATATTGFFAPFEEVAAGRMVEIISIIPITVAFLARYRYRRAGAWRGTYVISAVLTFYLNCVILMGQGFQKIPSLQVLAPTRSEPLFQMAQWGTLLLFVLIGYYAFKNYHPKQDAPDTGYISPHLEAD